MLKKQLGELLPGTGNLYEWGETQILKFYGEDVPEDWVKYLGSIEKALYDAGLPVPAVGELIEMDGSLGQVYERIDGSSMADKLFTIAEADSEEIVKLAHVFADTHAKIHEYREIQVKVHQQGEMFRRLIPNIEILPDDLKEGVLNALDKLPGGDRLCHGDFHPYNVILSGRGPIIIDWNNAHIGNPIEDVARSTLMLSGFPEMVPQTRPIIDQFNQEYLKRYFQNRPENQDQLDAWRPIVAAIRFLDNIPELTDWLLEQIKSGLDQ